MSPPGAVDATNTVATPPTPADADSLRNDVIQRFTARTAASKQYAAAHRAKHADKSAIGASFDPALKEAQYPIVIERAAGARLRDIDGNNYVDILQGLGTNLFGHNPEFVRDALAAGLEQGFPIGPQNPLAGQVAQLFTRLTGHDRVCFSNTGTEAVMTAVRLARTANKRTRIAVFTNSYHGHADPFLLRAPISEYARRKVITKLAGTSLTAPLAKLLNWPRTTFGVPAAPGIPAGIGRDVIVLDYGNPRSLDVIRANRGKLAAVLVEPVQSRCPELKPVEFLRELREITSNHDIALVFDEMVTGFRLHPGGAQGLFGIQADIATYSKIVGGGLPLSCIGGSARYLDHIDGGPWQFGDDSRPQAATTFFAGTFCKHPLALTAAHAVLTRMLELGPALQAGLDEKTGQLIDRLNRFTAGADIPVQYTRSGSFFAIALSASRIPPDAVTLLSYLMLCDGIFLRTGDRGGFIGTAHGEDDIDAIAGAIERGLGTLRTAGMV